MPIIVVIIALLTGGFLGWSIGANDAANCVGAAVGSRIMSMRRAIALTCLFALLGAVTLGSYVTKTIGKGIVPLDKLNHNTAVWIALASCFSAGLWVLIATYYKLPVSTSHSIVGAVAGAGLAMGTTVVWKKLLDIFICWIFTPIGAGILAFLLYRPFKRLLQNFVPKRSRYRFLIGGIYLTSIYLAFTWGANDVANVSGVIFGANIVPSFAASLIGAIAILVGILTWGRRVIETIGFRITHLLPLATFVAQIASGLNVHIYTLFGIPVSTSHSIVGAVFGVGIVRGIKAIERSVIRDIILAWSVTPFFAGVVSFLTISFLKIMKIV